MITCIFPLITKNVLGSSELTKTTIWLFLGLFIKRHMFLTLLARYYIMHIIIIFTVLPNHYITKHYTETLKYKQNGPDKSLIPLRELSWKEFLKAYAWASALPPEGTPASSRTAVSNCDTPRWSSGFLKASHWI